jgi:hypothetical protein
MTTPTRSMTTPMPAKSAPGRIILALVGFLLMVGVGGALATVVLHERVTLILAR